MAKKKAKTSGPTGPDLPTNPEFRDFVAFGSRLLAVPKSDIPPQTPKAPADLCEPPEEEGGHEYAAV